MTVFFFTYGDKLRMKETILTCSIRGKIDIFLYVSMLLIRELEIVNGEQNAQYIS